MAKRICMYCGLEMGESSSLDHNGNDCDSHGACPECFEFQLAKMRADLQKHKSIQSLDDLQKDVKRRIASGFYNSDIVNNQVATKIMQEAK